ncbi:hypothetical protein AB0M95_23900 [Sphaerisporangium sp. NPDC051017]|uniref:hypothetical protein n=1 Tax=Sphaerisporangium sp. NPDC051017 TaxID=3154636 RepID=UPI0034463943
MAQVRDRAQFAASATAGPGTPYGQGRPPDDRSLPGGHEAYSYETRIRRAA